MHFTAREDAEKMGQTNSGSESARLPPWAVSPEVWLMFRPKAAYEWLADAPEGRKNWTAARRPVYFAFLLGCFVSLVASQRLTLRHVAGGAINGGLLLLAQIAALRIVCWRERKVSFSRLVDLFFEGVLRRSKAGAAWDALRIWAMCWFVCILIFGWGALWSEYLRIPGR